MRPRPATPSPPGGRLPPAYAVLAVLFALAQMRMYTLLLPKQMLRSSEVTEGLVHGEAAWRVFQSRILTPWTLEILSAVTGGYQKAYDLFAVIMIALGGWLCAALMQRLQDPQRPALAALLLYQLTVGLLMMTNWLYPWDLLALPLFAMFHHLVLRRGSKRAFAALIGVSLLNSEVALFMAGWLVADPILRHLFAPRRDGARAGLDWATVGLGVALLVGGVLLIEGLRSALLVKETLTASSLPEAATYGRDYHLTIGQNLRQLVAVMNVGLGMGHPILIPVFLVGVLALAVQLVRADRVRFAGLSLMTVLMVASFLCFGDIYESRIFMPLVPFVAMHGWTALSPAPRPGNPRASGGQGAKAAPA